MDLISVFSDIQGFLFSPSRMPVANSGGFGSQARSLMPVDFRSPERFQPGLQFLETIVTK